MEKMTCEQLLEILAMLLKTLVKMFLGGKTEWNTVPRETAQSIVKGDPESFAMQFVKFLANGGRVIFGGLKIATVPFDPAKFIGKGWTFWKGPKDGSGLEGEEERDKASLALAEVDFGKAEFLTCLEEGESSITGEEKLIRLRKLGRPIYGANQFMGLWQDYQGCQNKAESVLEKLYQQGVIKEYVDLPGDPLRYPSGHRYVLCLYRSDDGQWHWRYDWLGNDWSAHYFSAVSQQVS